METCACSGCDQPGTNKCSACKTIPYCGPICQTADWPRHKEECPGHLHKVGMANLEKAQGFYRANNWPQVLRYSDLAATKFKQIKDRPIEDISNALNMKFNSLNMMGRHREALECAKEWYCLWLTKHTHPCAIQAGFALIECCIHNKEFFDAVLYARTTWETLTLSGDNHIPEAVMEQYIANGAKYLAKSTLALIESGGIPKEEQNASGKEVIMLARKAVEMDTQLHGPEDLCVAHDALLLGQVLERFNGVDDDEILRLYGQAKAIFARVEGLLSPNVATCEDNFGIAYYKRALLAYEDNDLGREIASLELALPHFREADRIFRSGNHVVQADRGAKLAGDVEHLLRQAVRSRTAATRA